MKNQIIISLVILFSISLISAITYPHAFYGSVGYNNISIPNGCSVIAKLNNVSEICEIINGKYGCHEEDCPHPCIITSENLPEEIVEFYIEDKKIGEHDFIDKNITKLNFVLDFLPPCANSNNNTNNSSENNESSENNDSSSSSSSTSSKSSGGSSSGSSTDGVINLNYETGSLNGVGFIKTNESSEKTSSGITGSVINFIGSGKVAITFISLIGILIAFIAVKKLRKKN